MPLRSQCLRILASPHQVSYNPSPTSFLPLIFSCETASHCLPPPVFISNRLSMRKPQTSQSGAYHLERLGPANPGRAVSRP